MQPPDILTIDEAAAQLRISRWSLYNLIRTNRIRTITIGRRRLVPATALADCVDRLLQEEAA